MRGGKRGEGKRTRRKGVGEKGGSDGERKGVMGKGG